MKSPTAPELKNDLKTILAATKPEVVYTHNPADKHDTHIGVVVASLQAMRELPVDQRPKKVIGCEVWRDLDWLPDADKVCMDVSEHENIAAAVNGVFDSQIAGGKRYDLATQGRRRAARRPEPRSNRGRISLRPRFDAGRDPVAQACRARERV